MLKHQSALPVVDQADKLVGIPTESDFLHRAVAADETLADIGRSYNVSHSTINRLR